MKINVRTEVKWNRREIEKIAREAAENVFGERAREASALKCEEHGKTPTITPTGVSHGSQEFSITACCNEHRDRVARFLVGDE